MTLSSPNHAKSLSDLSPYIYGTTRLGDENIPFDERVKMAHLAMDAKIWFHTSDAYGNALDVLRVAFDQDRNKVPKLIIKIGWSTIDEIKETIRKNLDPLGLDSLSIGQLCLSGQLAEEFANGGDCYQGFTQLKEEGLVERLVVEVFPWTSNMSLKALQGNYPAGIIDGYIFYLNPLQRFASNALWDLLLERDESIIAMRTVAGGNVHALRDVPGAAWKAYLQERAIEIAPIFERSGIESWATFCVRFAHSFPQVRATVGATSRPANLQEFLSATQTIQPLPQDIMAEIDALHYRWSDETDIHAEPWSM